MPKSGGDEVWRFVPIEQDDGEPRTLWTCTECPGQGCTKASWRSAKVYSYHGRETCEEYLVSHLMRSGNHALSEAEATDLAQTANFEQTIETKEDRDEYREQAEEAAAAFERAKQKKRKAAEEAAAAAEDAKQKKWKADDAWKRGSGHQKWGSHGGGIPLMGRRRSRKSRRQSGWAGQKFTRGGADHRRRVADGSG